MLGEQRVFLRAVVALAQGNFHVEAPVREAQEDRALRSASGCGEPDVRGRVPPAAHP